MYEQTYEIQKDNDQDGISDQVWSSDTHLTERATIEANSTSL